ASSRRTTSQAPFRFSVLPTRRWCAGTCSSSTAGSRCPSEVVYSEAMRLGVVLALAVGTFVVCVQAAFATGNDRGLLRPPEQLSESAKTIWMGEWVACRHERLGRLAKI